MNYKTFEIKNNTVIFGETTIPCKTHAKLDISTDEPLPAMLQKQSGAGLTDEELDMHIYLDSDNWDDSFQDYSIDEAFI